MSVREKEEIRRRDKEEEDEDVRAVIEN